MEKTIKCEMCGKDYTYEEKAGYPRKYCLVCSAKRKAEFEGNKQSPEDHNIDAGIKGANAPSLMSQRDISITSQCLTKVWGASGKSPQEVLEAFRFFVLAFEKGE